LRMARGLTGTFRERGEFFAPRDEDAHAQRLHSLAPFRRFALVSAHQTNQQ
jgi:hypothetical protein